VIGAILGLVLAMGAWYLWYGYHVRRLTDRRLAELIGSTDADKSREEPRRTIRAFPPRYRFAAPATGVVAGAALWFGVGLPVEVAAAAGVLLGVFAHLVEDHLGGQKAATIEARQEMSRMAAENILAALAGQAPPNLVRM
jgi:hypothetical protein